MQSGKKAIIRTAAAAAIMTVIALALLAVFSLLIEKGTVGEDMMSGAVYAAVFTAAFAGGAIINKGRTEGRIIRALIVGIALFGVPFMIGKCAYGQPAETAYSIVMLAISIAGAEAGAVICNKKRRYRRR